MAVQPWYTLHTRKAFAAAPSFVGRMLKSKNALQRFRTNVLIASWQVSQR